jgi:hypothetical protein
VKKVETWKLPYSDKTRSLCGCVSSLGVEMGGKNTYPYTLEKITAYEDCDWCSKIGIPPVPPEELM